MDAVTVALSILALVASLFVKGNWKGKSWLEKSIMILGILVVISTAFYNCNRVKKERLIEKINSKVGKFDDLENVTIPLISVGDGPVSLGITSFTIFNKNPNIKPLFRVYIKDSKLYVDIVVWGRDKKPVAVIDGNEWTMYSDDYEYNNDDNGFEIVTKGDRQVYFQLILKDGIAHILGIVTNSEGDGVKFLYQDNKPTDIWGTMMMIRADDDSARQDAAYLPIDKAIFKYPRSKYLGQRK